MDNKLKILLVDDDKIMLFLHEMFLKKSGILHETILCFNGQDALDFLDNFNGPASTTFLVLLDINMPVMNGWEFLETIQDRTYPQQVWVVMVSSATEETEKDKAFTFTQVVDYLQKPLTIETCRKMMMTDQLKAFFETHTGSSPS